MNPAQQKVVQYLNEAHATEQAMARELQSQIAITPRGSYRSCLESHLDETRDHAARVGARLEALDRGSNPLTAFVGVAETVLGQAVALGKAPFALLRGSGGEEKVLKNAKDACANETLEIATYTAIERLARAVGDDETAALAASIRADEEKMLQRVLREISELTKAVVRADVRGEHSYDRTATGAAGTVRHAGRATKNGARKATAATKRTPRRARKVPRGPQAGRRSKAGAASDYDLAILGYGTLTAEEITGKLPELSQIDLAKIDSYERRHKNRTTVLNRIASLRGDEPRSTGDPEASQRGDKPTPADDLAASQRGDETTPAGDPAGAYPASAVAGTDDDLRAAADAGDGAAAFTLWERLRDTDFAAAEGWLRTAAEAGDVRAAYRLGTLLWERRDLDAAEATLRTATVDPQAAYALGLLLWRERSDPQAAVEWLDRAARADDPAAERDLGILLREHGDLHGAHYWLSRAAERDGEARGALAGLVENR